MSSSSSRPPSGFDSSQESYLGKFQINETPDQLTFATPLTPDSSSSRASDQRSPPRDPRPRRTGQNDVPRPRNAFIFFRSEFSNEKKEVLGQKDNRHISQIAGEIWKLMSAEKRARFVEMAEREKLLHQQLYPDYKYCPNKRGPRKPRITYGNTPEHKLYYEKMAVACVEVGDDGTALTEAIRAMPKVEDDRPKRTRKAKAKIITAPAPATSTSRKAEAIRNARAASVETISSDVATCAWSPATSEEFAFDTPLLPPTTHAAGNFNQPVHCEMLAEQSPPFYGNYNNYPTDGQGYPFPAAGYPSVDGTYSSTAAQLHFDEQVEHIDGSQNYGESIDVYPNYLNSQYGLSAYEMHDYSGPLSPGPSSLSTIPLYDYNPGTWDAAWPASY